MITPRPAESASSTPVTTFRGAAASLACGRKGCRKVFLPTASAVFVTVTATQADAPGFITLWGSGSTCRTFPTSTMSAGPQAIANTTLTRVVGGQFEMFNESPTHIILDVAGYTV